jgi:hypothetical protein
VTTGSGHDREPSADAARERQLTVGLLAGGDCFEDFYDKIGVSIEDFRTRHSGG